MKIKTAGFTLIELLVVLAIAAILGAIAWANFGEVGAKGNDAKRKSDLILLQNAIERYKQDHGRYPKGCNGTNGDAWSGEPDYQYKCSDNANNYIVGLAPAYIPVLPRDPVKGASDSDYGYVYLTNAKGTVYKLVIRNSVETETLSSYSDTNFKFKACDVVLDSDSNLYNTTPYPEQILPKEGSWYALGSCNIYRYGGGYQRPATECSLSNISKSYAVWGGHADPSDVTTGTSEDIKIERGTEQIICDMPS